MNAQTHALRAAIIDAGVDALIAVCIHVDTSPRGSFESPGSVTFRPPLCRGSIEIVRLETLADITAYGALAAAQGRLHYARLTTTA